MKVIKIIAALFALSGANAFAQVDGPLDYGDSGITGPKYSEIVKSLEDLQQAHPDSAKTINLGKTVSGRDLVGILISRSEKPTQLVAITGAIHGNEYLNIADRLPGAFLNPKNQTFKSYLDNGGAIFVLPIQNPDGYERDRRTNSNGEDLNRSFPNEGNGNRDFHQPETKSLAEWKDNYLTETGAEFKISIDYHCCQGSLLLPLAWTRSRSIPAPEYEAHAQLGRLLTAQIPEHIFGQSSRTIGYSAVGTSMDYWYAKYGTLSGVLEGDYRTEKGRFDQHVRWWDTMISSL